MPSSSQLQALRDNLTPEATLLSDPSSSEFQAHLQRWSNINFHTPSAIVLPRTEEDCLSIIKWVRSTGTPFVCKSGGMSLYSTIDETGIVIDLSDFSSVTYDESTCEATLVGGVRTKDVAVELARHGVCTTLPSSNTVGAIPFFLNGGNSPLVSKLGYASDNILRARVITAAGEIINVSEDEHADLLYAIRGAGQFFGLVVALTVRTYPVFEVFGNAQGHFWSGRFIFPLDRIAEVADAMRHVVNDSAYCAGGLIAIAAPPPTRSPAVVVTARLIHPKSEERQQDVFKALYDLEPVASGGGMIPIENNGDALQPLMAPGDFKKLRLTACHAYDPSVLPEIAELWRRMTSTCPDAMQSMFSILCESQSPLTPTFDSANGMHGIRFWANNLTWCTSAESQEIVQGYLEKVIAVTRRGQKPAEYVDFANSLREPESQVNRRYKGVERLEWLKRLKMKWDPEGLFGGDLL